MAWVFLTDRHAYKLKKPVILPFLDFGTVEARRHDCEEEVRLNGRLAPNIYLGIVTLTLEADGTAGPWRRGACRRLAGQDGPPGGAPNA